MGGEDSDKGVVNGNIPGSSGNGISRSTMSGGNVIEHETGGKGPLSLLRKIGMLLSQFDEEWPRTSTLIQRQLLVTSLIAVTLLGGYCISTLESPEEINENNAVVRQAWFLRSIPIADAADALLGLPSSCLQAYNSLPHTESGGLILDANSTTAVQETLWEQFEESQRNPRNTSRGDASRLVFADEIFDPLGTGALLPSSSNFTDIDLDDFTNEIFPNSDVVIPPILSTGELLFDMPISGATEVNLHEFVLACEEMAAQLLQNFVVLSLKVAKHEFNLLFRSSTGLTFNWIRCWNETEFEDVSDEGSSFANQTKSFVQEWDASRSALFDQYVADDCQGYTVDNLLDSNSSDNEELYADMIREREQCYWNATKKAVRFATGGSVCKANIESAAWFWFTIMTTVGYGNFAPSTNGGRVLVYCFGWLSIIFFGWIMFLTAYTYSTILDDFLTRWKMKWLQRPIYATLFWLVVSVSWVSLVAFRARQFWDDKVPYFEYTTGDSYWFAYISLATVGLGDFYLQPQGLFAGGVFLWSSLMLNGFVFVTTFFSKVGDLVYAWFPIAHWDKLDYALARTTLFRGLNNPISSSLETLKGLVEDLDHESERLSVEKYGKTRKRTYRTSFNGNSLALAPDGNTIYYHRIKNLAEKKRLLIRLLEDTQAELDDLDDDSFLDRLSAASGGSSNKQGDVRMGNSQDTRRDTLDHASRPEANIKDLDYEERVLESILTRTREARSKVES